MLDVVDRAYESRIVEEVEFNVNLLRSVDPDLPCALDVEAYRAECERRLRARELGD